MKKVSNDYDLTNLIELDVQGLKFYSTPRVAEFYKHKDYEGLSIRLFKKFLKGGTRFLDVGAHYGIYSLICAKQSKKNEVISIEPVKENFQILNKNIKANNFANIKSHNIAISNKAGEAELFVANASDSSGLDKHPNTKTIFKRKVRTDTIDNIVGEGKIDIIKIDTEGHEMPVLKGMMKTIKNNPNLKLFIEFNPKCLTASNTSPNDFLKQLLNYKFDIFLINDQQNKIYKLRNDTDWEGLMDVKSYANLLCVPKESLNYVYVFSHSSQLGGGELCLFDLLMNLPSNYIAHVTFPNGGPLINKAKTLPLSYSILDQPWWICQNNDKQTVELLVSTIDQSIVDVYDVNPNILYAHTSVISQGLLIKKITNLPLISHIQEFGTLDHGMKFIETEKNRSTLFSKLSDHIIFNSKATLKYYSSYDSNIINKSTVIYNSLSFNPGNGKTYGKRKKKLYLIMLGTVSVGKGQFDAIKAIRKIVNMGYNNITLKIYGNHYDLNYWEKVNKYISRHNLWSYVELHEFTEDVKHELEISDILLMCSRNEAFGRVTIEAFKMGLPVIGYKSGGTVELIEDGYNGFLYEKKSETDTEELVEKILFFYKDRKQIEKLGGQAREFSKSRFLIDDYVNSIIYIFDRILKDSHRFKIDDVLIKNYYNNIKIRILTERVYENVTKQVSDIINENKLLQEKLYKQKDDLDRMMQEVINDRKNLQNENKKLQFTVDNLQQSIESSRALKISRKIKKIIKK